MNEEISKILQMLEAGKINAEEAERLIRALSDAPKSPAEDPGPELHTFPNPFRDLQELFRVFSTAQDRAVRRQHRWLYWRHYKHARCEQEARAKRAETMDTAARIRYILTDRVLVEKSDFDENSNLNDLLSVSRWCCERTNNIAWDNLRYGLEDEFGLEIAMEDLRACETVQGVIDYVTARVPAPTLNPQPSEPAESEPVPRKAKAPRTGPVSPQPAG